KHLKKQPAWLPTVARTPPSTNFARTPAPAFQSRPKIKAGKPRLFQPQRIEYTEDALRRRFYTEHPWELARPVKILETDGQDGKRFDWSKLRQAGRALTGENVVQRQQYLMTHEQKSRDEAYDMARQEFYKERMVEQVERTIAMEEALAFGATFDKSEMQVGLELEDQVLVDWKAKATAAKQLV
ncbi:mitochondrial ribosomal protein S25-domain-containing protein, partial [Protomyces lactucae-debilis]